MLQILPKILIRYCTVFCFQNGDAPLHIAVALGRKRMAKKLIRLGASGHIRNNVSMLLSRLKSHYLLPSREKRFYDYMLTIRHGHFSMKSKFVLLSNVVRIVKVNSNFKKGA